MHSLHLRPLICLLVLLGGLAGCRDEQPDSNLGNVSIPTTAIQAATLCVQKSVWPEVILAQGSLVADEESTIGAMVAGRVDEVFVELGDPVQVGSKIACLDQRDLQLKVEQAKHALDQARAAIGLKASDDARKLEPENAPPVRQEKALWDEAKSSLQRAVGLLRQNAIPQGEFDLTAAAEKVAEARYASAVNAVREKIVAIQLRESELAIAEQALFDSVTTSPIEGFVLNRSVAPGAYVNIGQPIATIVRTNPLRFRGSVPERFARSLALGQKVKIFIDDSTKPIHSTVTRISPALELSARSLVFEATIDNSDHSLRSGLFAVAHVETIADRERIVVSEDSIVDFAGVRKVWKVVDGNLTEQPVVTGEKRSGQIEIVSGLNTGDIILQDASLGARNRKVESPIAVGKAAETEPVSGHKS